MTVTPLFPTNQLEDCRRFLCRAYPDDAPIIQELMDGESYGAIARFLQDALQDYSNMLDDAGRKNMAVLLRQFRLYGAAPVATFAEGDFTPEQQERLELCHAAQRFLLAKPNGDQLAQTFQELLGYPLEPASAQAAAEFLQGQMKPVANQVERYADRELAAKLVDSLLREAGIDNPRTP